MTTVSKWGSLAAFILLTLGGGTLIGTMTMPGPWYEALAKPPFNPPNWLFGPAWTILYILVGIAGWRVYTRIGAGLLMNLWIAQLVVNFLWSPVFFGMQSISGGLVVVVAMLVLILAFIGLAWNRERISALLFLPYAAWSPSPPRSTPRSSSQLTDLCALQHASHCATMPPLQ